MTIRDIGPHRVRHGSVMDDVGIAALMGGEKAAIMYSDPPWGEGNLKYWGTLNAKQNPGQNVPAQEVSLVAFLRKIFSVANQYVAPEGMLFIEYGVRWRDMIVDQGEGWGFRHLGVAQTLYRSGSNTLPLDLHLFAAQDGATQPPPDHYFRALEGTKGLETVLKATAVYAEPGGIVLDPCCGMGYSAEMALSHGMRFRGNELNAARLAKTVERLERRR